MLGEAFVWHVRLEAEKSLQEALQQIQQLKNEIDALKQRLEAGSGTVQYRSHWEKPQGSRLFSGESHAPCERLWTCGESGYSLSIRNCVKTTLWVCRQHLSIRYSSFVFSRWNFSRTGDCLLVSNHFDLRRRTWTNMLASTWLHMTLLCIGSRLVAAWQLTLCTGPPPAKVEVPAPVQVMLKPHSETEKGATLQHVTTTTL